MKLFYAYACLLLAIPTSGFSAQRLITIGGSVTESVFALGLGEQIVATDTSSTWPEQTRKLPKVGYARTLAAEGILAFSPDLLLVSDLAGPTAVLDKIRDSGVAIVRLPTAPPLQDSLAMLQLLADTLKVSARGQALTATIEQELSSLTKPTKPIKALALIGGSGGQMMAAGRDTRADAMFQLAGAHNVAHAFSGYRPIGAESLMLMAPQALVIPDHALPMLGGSVAALLKNPAIAVTPAGQSGHVVVMDGLLLLGMGPRVAQAGRQLQQRLSHAAQSHPDQPDTLSGATPKQQQASHKP